VTKFSQWYKEIVLPAGLLASFIIGAGIFALPYVFYQAGFLVGLFYLVLFTAVFVTVHRMYGYVIENTQGKHRFVGYARIHLGRWGFITSIFTTAIGFTLVLTAYIALASEFLSLIFPGYYNIYGPFIFWGVGSLAIILSLKRLANFEFSIALAMGVIVIALFIAGFIYGDGVNISTVNLSSAFLPYGIILFALAGRAAISTISDYYERKKISKDKMNRAVTLGTIAPAFIYLLFIIAVLALSGDGVSPDGLSGLVNAPYPLLFLAVSLGIFALWTSYFFLGVAVRDIFRYDLKLHLLPAIIAVVFLPIGLYLAGLTNFLFLMGIIGGVFLAMDSIMTISMYSKIKGWRFSARILVLLFVVGAIYSLLRIF